MFGNHVKSPGSKTATVDLPFDPEFGNHVKSPGSKTAYMVHAKDARLVTMSNHPVPKLPTWSTPRTHVW